MSNLRRLQRAAWFAGVAAMYPSASYAGAAPPAIAAETHAFKPPSCAMVLTRTVRRPLPGGAEIVTRRQYEVRFVPDNGGYRIDGQLLGAEVDAPPSLHDLAELERARPDAEMFPMRLDSRGMLLPRESARPSEQSAQAVKLALQRLSHAGLSPDETAKAAAFVRQIAASSGQSPWPDDLFSPAPGQRRQTQTIPLPNGAQGQVAIEIEARTEEPSGLVAFFERRVTTWLGNDSRVTREIWTLQDKS